MDLSKMQEIMNEMEDITLLVVGDYFLDKYLIIDAGKDELSLETGLTAYQVTGKRLSPGAAGTVTNNITALGVGKVIALGIVGQDGEGFELLDALEKTGVDTQHIIRTKERVTPTYTKPMRLEEGKEQELNRLDIKNWSPTPQWLEKQIIDKLYELKDKVDAIVVLDQVTEENYGVITEKVREALAQIGEQQKDLIIYADSRRYTDKFRNIIVKCNHHEVVGAIYPDFNGEPGYELIKECGAKLSIRTGRPVYITWGEKGQLVFNGYDIYEVPGIRVPGPIDICGAGDAASSGIVSSLCAGASLSEAAVVGNIVASITIQQIGTTGTASPEQIIERFQKYFT